MNQQKRSRSIIKAKNKENPPQQLMIYSKKQMDEEIAGKEGEKKEKTPDKHPFLVCK